MWSQTSHRQQGRKTLFLQDSLGMRLTKADLGKDHALITAGETRLAAEVKMMALELREVRIYRMYHRPCCVQPGLRVLSVMLRYL